MLAWREGHSWEGRCLGGQGHCHVEEGHCHSALFSLIPGSPEEEEEEEEEEENHRTICGEQKAGSGSGQSLVRRSCH